MQAQGQRESDAATKRGVPPSKAGHLDIAEFWSLRRKVPVVLVTTSPVLYSAEDRSRLACDLQVFSGGSHDSASGRDCGDIGVVAHTIDLPVIVVLIDVDAEEGSFSAASRRTKAECSPTQPVNTSTSTLPAVLIAPMPPTSRWM